MFKKRYFSVHNDFKTGFLCKLTLFLGIFLLIIFIFFKACSVIIGTGNSGFLGQLYDFSQMSDEEIMSLPDVRRNQQVQEYINSRRASIPGYGLGGALETGSQYAAIGASAGSVFPGLGTVIGAGATLILWGAVCVFVC